MTKKIKHNIETGMDRYRQRIDSKKNIYLKLLDMANGDQSNNWIWRITDKELFNETIATFGAMLDGVGAKYNLDTIYELAIHKKTGALIVNNKGATLFSYSPKTKTPYLIRHIGLCVYMPGLGVEFVNVGLVGDVYNEHIVLRSESACAPSFLFGSQRCNCHHQWESIKELAAGFNKTSLPKARDGKQFEMWVQDQLEYKEYKHYFKNKNGLGFVLMHVDTQNGMGSGYSDGEFSFDLYTRASMRHRGEYSSEQIHKTTMAGGFEAIGLKPDPRRGNNNAGYKLSRVVLDYLDVSKKIVFLTNNPLKMQELEKGGYELVRIPLMGEINLAGAQEAKERGYEFEHFDINENCVSFASDFKRLKKEIKKITKK